MDYTHQIRPSEHGAVKLTVGKKTVLLRKFESFPYIQYGYGADFGYTANVYLESAEIRIGKKWKKVKITVDGGESDEVHSEMKDLTLSYKEPLINVSSISLSPPSLTMEVGDQRTIVPTVLPNNATDKTVIWRSSNPSIATVEDGTVTALSVGSATITAASADGGITAACPVIIRCEHSYQTSITPAGMEKEGYITKTYSKCGEETETPIPGIENIELAQTSYDYDGKAHQPDITVIDEEGNTLEAGNDYTISYSENTANIGTHTVTLNFIGNYVGTQTRTFTVSPIYTDSISLSPLPAHNKCWHTTRNYSHYFTR